MMATLCLNTLYDSITFRLYFKEKLNIPELIGVICLLFVALSIYLSKSELSVSSDLSLSETQKSKYAFKCIFLALISPLLFSIKHFAIRYAKSTYNGFDINLDAVLLMYTISMVLSMKYFI